MMVENSLFSYKVISVDNISNDYDDDYRCVDKRGWRAVDEIVQSGNSIADKANNIHE